MAKQSELFPRPARSRPRVRAHLVDAGNAPNGKPIAKFSCKCGWSSGWVYSTTRVSELRRGIPCETCNKESPGL